MTNEKLEQDLAGLRIDRQKAAPPKPKGSKRFVVLLVLVCLFVLSGVFAFYMLDSKGGKEVEVAVASRQEANASPAILTASGYVIARHKIFISSKMTGRIRALYVKKSDRVKKNQIIARLEDDEILAQFNQARANLEAAKARLRELEAGSRPQEVGHAQATVEQAEANMRISEMHLRENEELFKKGIISKHQLDESQSRHAANQAAYRAAKESHSMIKIGPRQEQIENARAQVGQAQAALQHMLALRENTLIRSPIDGVVLDKLAEQGELLSPGLLSERGAKPALVTVADVTDLQVELDISEADINRIKLDQPATIVPDAYPDRSYKGVLEEIAPEANRQKATIQVKVKVLNRDDYLRSEMSAKVTFLETAQVGTEKPKILVPKAAVLQRDGSSIVFLAKDSRALQKPVRLGRDMSGFQEVLDGLQGGETVIVKGQEGLKDGTKILVK